MKRIFYFTLILVALQACSYKHSYQPIVFSDLYSEPALSNADLQHYPESEKTNFKQPSFIEAKSIDSLKVASGLINIKKVSNFRDMGTIVNKQGRFVSRGKFYRSGALNKLRKSSFAAFKDLGINTVIDLRTDKEIQIKPDHLPREIAYYNYQGYSDSQDMFTKTRKDVLKGRITPQMADSLVTEFYGLYLTQNPSEIKRIISTILDNPEPVLFHCSAGKDRTGMIAALVLSILQVDREIIFQEYLLSNNFREKQVAQRMKQAKAGKVIFPNINYQVVETFSWVKPIFLQAMFDSIEQKYGSVDNYIENELKITPLKRQAYIQAYTQVWK